jgi:hypothetical protein
LYVVQRSSLFDHAEVFRLLERHGCLPRTAFIDGHDYSFGPDFFWLHSPAFYFQKENLGEHDAHTLLFGIEDRFCSFSGGVARTERKGKVMFAYRYDTHRDRPLVRERLQDAGFDVVWSQIEDLPEQRSRLYWQTGRRHNRSYYQALAECSVGVAAEGEAVDTLRYWEFAASNAVLVAPPIEETIVDFPDPPTAGVHYVRYRGPDDVAAAVEEAIERYDEVLPAQREFFLTHHRSANRARQVIKTMFDN